MGNIKYKNSMQAKPALVAQVYLESGKTQRDIGLLFAIISLVVNVISSQNDVKSCDIMKPQRKKEDVNMSAININKNNFQNEVLNSDKKVLLDF